MNSILQALTGTDKLTDQVIAADFLNAAKTGIKTYATALCETTSPEISKLLKQQLDDAIETHEEITKLMMDRGWYNAKDMQQQIRMDIQNAQNVLSSQGK